MTIARRLATALPATRDRLVAGTLGMDHARVMTKVAPTSETRTDALAWLIDTRTGETTTPEQFVQTVPVDFPDPVDDPDGTRTRELVTAVLQDAVTEGTLVTGEGLVLREAGVLNADQFRVVARHFATVTDPDTDDTEDDKAAAGEFLDLAKTFGGYHVEGFLTDDSAITRIVFGADGAALDVGRAQRTVTGQMRRAVIARDKHCVYPGCDQPPSRCEVHHAVRHWADGGETSVANSALLCWFHHQLVDARGITMHWTGKPTTHTTTDTARTDTTSTTPTTAVGALVETGWAFTDARGHHIRLPEPLDTPHPPTSNPPDAKAA